MREIECTNCGAVFDAGEPKCPYCGHINPMGAEAKFLRDLEKTRKELNQIYGISSFRKTAEDVKMNIAYRWFCGYYFNDEVVEKIFFLI